MSIKKILISLIIFIIGIFVGFGFGSDYGEDRSIVQIARLNRALDDIFPQPPAEIFSVFGVITAIEDDEVSIKIASPSQRRLPGDIAQKETRVITINKDTKIIQFDPFAVSGAPNPTAKEFPEPEQKIITLNDLKVGDSISVSAEENIKTKQRFIASKIQMQILPE